MSGGKVDILFEGQRFSVDDHLTILQALESVGYRFVKGVGCRGGVCGACAVFYRINGDHTLKTGLSCQSLVEQGMMLMQLPYFPQKKVCHTLEVPAGERPEEHVVHLYPEVNRCIMCGECSRICPMDIDVMGYVGMIKRGDLEACAEESFDCIQCGICVSRCPAQISQPNAALAARRYYGSYRMARAEHLAKRVAQIDSGRYTKDFKKLVAMSQDELKNLYNRREREPDLAAPGTWLPEDRSRL